MNKNGWMDQASAQICQKIRQTLLMDLNNPVREHLESDSSMNMSLMLDFEEFSISAKSTNCNEPTLCESNMKNFESETIENPLNKSNSLYESSAVDMANDINELTDLSFEFSNVSIIDPKKMNFEVIELDNLSDKDVLMFYQQIVQSNQVALLKASKSVGASVIVRLANSNQFIFACHRDISKIKSFLESILTHSETILVHNLSNSVDFDGFDYELTLQLFQKAKNQQLFDLKIACWMLDSGHHFEAIQDCFAFCNVDLSAIAKSVAKNQNLSQETQIQSVCYFEAHSILLQMLNAKKSMADLFWLIEMPVTAILNLMNSKFSKPFVIDQILLRKYYDVLKKEMCTVERKANDILGYVINLRSPFQLRQLIFDKLELDKNIKLPNSLKWSQNNQQSKTTSEEMLNCLRGTHPIIEIILIHRKLSKITSTYVEPFLTNGNLCQPQWHQTRIITGRISCTDPNVQTIPKQNIVELPEYPELKAEFLNIRKAFKSHPGRMLVSIDFKQIELRLCACISKDEELIRDLQNPDDFFSSVASKILQKDLNELTENDRAKTKIMIYGWIYGCRKSANEIFNVQNAMQFDSKWINEKYKGFKALAKSVLIEMNETNEVVSIMGRVRNFHLTKAQNKFSKQNERQAINCKIQSSAADIFKYFLMLLYSTFIESNRLCDKVSILALIHDEIILEVENQHLSELIQSIESSHKILMQSLILPLDLPLKISYGQNWSEMEKID